MQSALVIAVDCGLDVINDLVSMTLAAKPAWLYVAGITMQTALLPVQVTRLQVSGS